MIKVLAVDPGETTGYVLGIYTPNDGSFPTIDFGHTGVWYGIQEMRGLYQYTDLFAVFDVLVVEKYIIYPNRAKQHIGNPLFTSQVIGRLKWLAYLADKPCVEYLASQAKQRWPDARLRKYYDLTRFPSRHTVDALRHLLTYCEKHNG